MSVTLPGTISLAASRAKQAARAPSAAEVAAREDAASKRRTFERAVARDAVLSELEHHETEEARRRGLFQIGEDADVVAAEKKAVDLEEHLAGLKRLVEVEAAAVEEARQAAVTIGARSRIGTAKPADAERAWREHEEAEARQISTAVQIQETEEACKLQREHAASMRQDWRSRSIASCKAAQRECLGEFVEHCLAMGRLLDRWHAIEVEADRVSPHKVYPIDPRGNRLVGIARGFPGDLRNPNAPLGSYLAWLKTVGMDVSEWTNPK